MLIGHVSSIDRGNKTIHLKYSDRVFNYDYLIIAAGARHDYFGKPEWERYAWGLKTTRDALMIRERMLYSFEKAERTRKAEKRYRYLNFVIVGGGPTGVEMAGAIAEMTRKTMVQDFTNFSSEDANIILVEGTDRLLNRYPESLSKHAKKSLEKLGVDVRLNTFTTDVTAKGAQVGDEFVETENIIWAAGNAASPLIKAATDSINRAGQALVQPDFSTKESKAVFCIGDCAYLEDSTGHVVPAVAQGAAQAGMFVGRQIKRELKGKERETFTYWDKGKNGYYWKVQGGRRYSRLVFYWVYRMAVMVFCSYSVSNRLQEQNYGIYRMGHFVYHQQTIGPLNQYVPGWGAYCL